MTRKHKKKGGARMLRRREPKLIVCVRMDAQLKRRVEALAKERGVSFSHAVGYILETYAPVVAAESTAAAKAV